MEINEVINNAPNILNGWFNVVRDNLGILPESIKQMADDRLAICKACKYGGWRCGICGCPLAAKTKSINSKCDLGKW